MGAATSYARDPILPTITEASLRFGNNLEELRTSFTRITGGQNILRYRQFSELVLHNISDIPQRVAKLKKSEDRFDREMADELEEMFGAGSCFSGSWYRGRAMYNDEGGERMFGECGREIREGGWDGSGEPFLD